MAFSTYSCTVYPEKAGWSVHFLLPLHLFGSRLQLLNMQHFDIIWSVFLVPSIPPPQKNPKKGGRKHPLLCTIYLVLYEPRPFQCQRTFQGWVLEDFWSIPHFSLMSGILFFWHLKIEGLE